MTTRRYPSGRPVGAPDETQDWRVLGEGACAWFRTGSYAAGGAALVPGHGRAPAQRNRIHLDVWVPHDQAEARVAAALAAGGRLVSDRFAPRWWTPADPEGNEVDVATWMDH